MSPGPSPATDHDPAPPVATPQDAGAGDDRRPRGGEPATGPERLLGGRYAILGRVGAGGMATILRARDTVLEREVAIKVVHAHLAGDAAVLARFRTEARNAARLSHPNIVAVFDQGMADLPYIVMELIDGPSLRDVLVQRGPLAPAEALAVIEPLCAGLARAHAAGVVHRDIKPENVLVSAAGVPKLADFGIARAAAATNHTSTGTLVGSVHYMAPELVDGRDASAASDTYAVGVLLFELLTGRKPLPADTPMAVALRHANEDIPPPSAFDPAIPAAVDAVVGRATARAPEDRYADVAELGADLRLALPGGSSPVTVAGDDGQEHTLILPAERQDTMAVTAAGDLARRRTRTASRGQRPRRTRTRPRRRFTTVLLVLLLALGTAAVGGYTVYDRILAPVQSVPDLEGLTQEDAFAALRERGLDLVVADTSFDLTVPEGAVLSQEPSGQSRLRQGGAVQVVLSAGPRVVEMPDVLGRDRGEALALLEEQSFEIVPGEEFHDTAPAGTVIAQLPDPGTPIAQGETVNVTVSLGIEQVEVPDLTGLTESEAEVALRDARLAGEFTREYSDAQPLEHLVISQSLEPGTTVDKNSVLTVVVSRGPVTIELPDVVGDPVGAARDELQALGLVVRVETEPVPRLGPFQRGTVGRVEVTEPSAGEEVQRGDTVTLYSYRERS